jgi:hypothetical protein
MSLRAWFCEKREKKYELLRDQTITLPGGERLCRIRALKDFSDVKAGDLGGFVQSKRNLAQEGDAWIFGEARVYDEARVSENARVYDHSQISDFAAVYGNARVRDNARVNGEAQVFGNAQVFDNSWLFGQARVGGEEWLCGKARVFSEARVYHAYDATPTWPTPRW